MSGDAHAEPVLRVSGNVSTGGRTGITVLGIDPETIPALSGWRDDFSALPQRTLAARITPTGDAAPRGPVVPDGTTALELAAQGPPVVVTASVEEPGGGYSQLQLGEPDPEGNVLRVAVPREAQGGRIVALTISPPVKVTERGGEGRPIDVRLGLGALSARTPQGDVALGGYEDWLAVNGIEAETTPGGATITGTLTESAAARFRPEQPSDEQPLSVIASAERRRGSRVERRPRPPGRRRAGDRAGRGGRRSLPGRARGLRRRRPAPARHGPQLRAARDRGRRTRSGSAADTERQRAALAAELGRAPYNVLTVDSRAEIEQSLRNDPLARGTLLTLLAAALVALGLALVGVLLGVVSDVRDERGELEDLEAQGARPALLRRVVRLRSFVVVAVGVVGGLLTAALLGLLVVDLVSVTADARATELPLRTSVTWPVLGAALLAGRAGGRHPRHRSLEARVSRAAVEIRDVFRVYPAPEGGVVALQGLTLEVREGEICVVLGPSGSGKSSLLRLLAALDAPTAGSVRVLDRDLSRLGRRARAAYRAEVLGYADQHYWRALAPELELRELVGMQLGLAGAPRHERLGRAGELLERVGLLDRAEARPHELSGGEQQRVAVCAALAHRPRLLLADEPTGELDTANARLVYEAIAELAREGGTTTVLVSHDPESASVADRIVRVRDGRVSEEAAIADGGDESIVVGRGGWLRLSEELLRRTGIHSHAAARLHEDGILLQAAAGAAAPVEAPEDEALPAANGDASTVAQVHGLSRTYGEGAAAAAAIVGLDAAFPGGRLTAVTGPSGSGKTTLLHLLAGLDLPTAGEVHVLGEPVSALDRDARARFRAKSVALVSQDGGLVPFLTASENVELGLSLRGLEPEEAAARAGESLAAVGLAGMTGRRVSDLSSGQRERVAVARAVAGRPALLLADEPTARLDQANALAVSRLLLGLARETGAAVVCATHDPLLIEHADEVLDLEARRRAASAAAPLEPS